MEGLELKCFEIITYAGTARSNYIKALQKAGKKEYQEAKELIKSGEEVFVNAHKSHAEILSESSKNEISPNILLLHAEDLLMSAETICVLVKELVNMMEERDL